MIMAHGDDDGMVMPPRVAPYPVGIIPILRDDQDTDRIFAACDDLVMKLKAHDIRAFVDKSDQRTPDKMWGMIKKGVPVRVEIGAREVDEGTLTHVRRDLGRDSKETCSMAEFIGKSQDLLNDIHDTMLARARAFRDENTHHLASLADMEAHFKNGGKGFAVLDADILNDPGLERVKKEYSLTARCLPLDQPGKVIIAKAY
ncbi:MAG: hypothetical protein LRZ85_04215 [Alphaproteobacteria bacterium]|nr:hypothetical protein [Alphaproteobacteria bacterium]